MFRNLCDVTTDYGCFSADTVLMGGEVVSSGRDVLVLPPWVRPDMQLEWKGREWENERTDVDAEMKFATPAGIEPDSSGCPNHNLAIALF